MRRANGLLLAALGASAAVAVPANAQDDDTRGRRIVDVAFGAGLNTAQPGNELNHHVIPQTIRVRVGDVVNFVVSGLHVVRVYADGVSLQDLRTQIPDECEVNPTPPDEFPEQCGFDTGFPVPVIPPFETLEVYYEGINPLAPPPEPPPPPFAQPSAAVNRVEAVSFLEPGRYLVICAVLEHFNDGMWAWVEVRGREDDDDGDDGSGEWDYRPSGGGHH
ncbi:MAG TPA: hypothetical protein VIN61_05565 [Gammaproteobacteria bacterium]